MFGVDRRYPSEARECVSAREETQLQVLFYGVCHAAESRTTCDKNWHKFRDADEEDIARHGEGKKRTDTRGAALDEAKLSGKGEAKCPVNVLPACEPTSSSRAVTWYEQHNQRRPFYK